MIHSRVIHEMRFSPQVDTPVDMPARTRFQKYRGLKSFRSSPWDPLENLPSEYAKIAHFRSLNASRLRAVAEDPNSAYAPVGAYVTVWFSVPAEYAESAVAKSAAGEVLVVGALQRYENSMAAMHYNVTRAKDDGDVIRSVSTSPRNPETPSHLFKRPPIQSGLFLSFKYVDVAETSCAHTPLLPQRPPIQTSTFSNVRLFKRPPIQPST